MKTDFLLFWQLFLIAYSAAFMMTVGWLFAYDNEILELSIAFLILGALFTFLAIGASSRRIQDNLFTLEIKGNCKNNTTACHSNVIEVG